MEKLDELIKIKVLISGKTQSYTIDFNRSVKISELSILLCQHFNFSIEDIKIILNNKPLEKYKEEYLSSVISKDKKPYIIIYFNEKESNYIIYKIRVIK